MIKAIVVAALLFPGYAIACSWATTPPSPADLLEDLDRVFETRDVIFRGYVGKFDEEGVAIDVIETFKGADEPGDSFVYRAITSCDMFYFDTGAEYLFFGSSREGQIHFMIGNGAVRSDHPVFSKLLEQLRDRQSDQSSAGD